MAKCNRDKLNIKSPLEFSAKLQEVMSGIQDLFELGKEHELQPVSEDGIMQYSEEWGKSAFQASGQYDRPSEFLQSLLDMIRVNFEPYIFGTFFLNSNMSFIYDAMPAEPFQLGYISITGDASKGFSSFWHDTVRSYLVSCGYGITDGVSVFVAISVGDAQYTQEFLQDILTTLEAGVTVEEAMQLLTAADAMPGKSVEHQIHSGFCCDPGLRDTTRVSLWIFSKGQAVNMSH